MNSEEKLHFKLGKVLLDRFLDDLGKEIGNEKIKENVYSFLNGMKIGIDLAGSKYKEGGLFLPLGVIFGYAFSRIKSNYLKKGEET